jgi:hypothetical protein
MFNSSTNPPRDPQAVNAADSNRRKILRKVTVGLAAPTALLVFLNELVSFRQFFSSQPAPAPATVVIEHKNAAAAPAEDGKSKPLAVEAARFDEQDPNKLDLICRNPASEPAFIRAAVVEMVRVWRLQPVVAARGKLASSAEYTLTLPSEKDPSTMEKELSQEIPAKGLDRFTITIGPAPSKEAGAKVYWFRLRLQCGGETVPAGEFLLMTPPSSGTPQPTYAANQKIVAEINKATGVKNALLSQFLATAPAN